MALNRKCGSSCRRSSSSSARSATAYLGGDYNNDGTSDIPAGKQGISWTFWSWNPNSGDTGGILADDWTSVNQAKLAYLKPIEFDLGDGAGGTGPAATFVLTLSKPATDTVTVDFHTVAGDATSADFTGSSGSVTFAPGEQSKTISIAITPDQLSEANEHFTVVLTNATGATITRATGTATILDDDAPPVTPPPTPSPGLDHQHLERHHRVARRHRLRDRRRRLERPTRP
jgi:endoglucanase